jgi:hemoglobin
MYALIAGSSQAFSDVEAIAPGYGLSGGTRRYRDGVSEPESAPVAPSLYEVVGGAPFFTRLVDEFYAGVATDDVLAPLYPEHPDYSGARRRLTLFLVQYWGGPTTYSDERGHPRLRMRHFPYRIGTDERDRWLQHMTAAVATVVAALDADDDVRAAVAATLDGYFRPSAEHLRNDTGLPITSAGFRAQ